MTHTEVLPLFREYISMALRSLMTHRVRALLTMLGVIIGVSSVIILISLGAGAKDEAARQIRSLGSNLVMVNLEARDMTLPNIWLDDLKDKAHIAAASRVAQGKLTYSINGRDFDATVYGVNADFGYISALQMTSGAFFTARDMANKAPVAVIGKTVAEKLFTSREPLGNTIAILGIPFKVVGVVGERGTSFTGDMDKVIYIPLDFTYSLFQSPIQKTFYIASETEQTAELTRSRIQSYLEKKMPSQDSFMVFSQTQMIDLLDRVMGLLTSLLAGIAAISLVVGGIGIMNIMLVTVRERTKEIGVRKALGARRSYILWQFLVEAVIITVFGGLLGVALSYAVTQALQKLVGFPVPVGLNAIALSLAFSVVVGLIFGIYPAYKASQLEPVEALRFE